MEKLVVCGNLCMQVLIKHDWEHSWELIPVGCTSGGGGGEASASSRTLHTSWTCIYPFTWQSEKSLGAYKAFGSLYQFCASEFVLM